jgi:hypothetical protein
MENAKRMVLVDEKMLDNMLRKQDMSWKRPTDQTIKHALSKQMRHELHDEMMPDDLKAKHYQQILSRFLNTKRTLPDESPITPLPELIEEKKKKKTKSVPVPTRHSKRTVKTPKKFNWDQW